MLFSGAAIRIRTGDLILTKDALYRLSYSSECLIAFDLDIIAYISNFVNSFLRYFSLFTFYTTTTILLVPVVYIFTNLIIITK